MAQGSWRDNRAVRVLDGVHAVYLTICFVVLVLLVLLRGAYSGYRVGGVLLLLAVLAGLALALPFGLVAAVRRRWTRRSATVVGAYGAVVVVIIALDVLTN